MYLATDVRHERKVAVKVLRPDLSASIGSERFLQEIRIAARLGHPHIVPLLDSGAAGPHGETLYYVMPYITGESLRQRLAREGELPVSDAVRIMRDVADALVYAHEHGVVHRDIKPENILLSGRHALVTDFGVAKAVSEATGRSRITTAGIALGTPAYMSPEQAAADPHVDHRADIYALGVVGYEMVAGDPPFTGGTPQQVLAAHMTEAPRPVSVRRPVVPPALADAIMRCIEKKAADRWQSAESLLAQLEIVQTTPTGGSTPTDTRPVAAVSAPARRRRLMVAGTAALLVAIAALGLWRTGWFSRDLAAAVTLRDRTQLTFTGRIQTPSISPDGKQLAYVTKECTETTCTYSVHVQDIGGTASRRVLEGAASVYFIEWSPDRRHLLVSGTIGGRWGVNLVAMLGGPARRVEMGGFGSGGGATFFAGGDSLLQVPPISADSVQWIRVTTLAGAIRDSIRIETEGLRVGGVAAVPGTPWIMVALALVEPGFQYRIIDRQGREAARTTGPFGEARMSADALWLAIRGEAEQATVTRTPLDPASGRLGSRTDTVYTGRFTSFSVTADGGALAVDDGAYQHSVYALEMSDVLAGRFPDSRRIAHGSTPVWAQLSHDGSRILLRRSLPGSGGAADIRWSLQPFDGGVESPLALPAGTDRAFWEDPKTLAITARQGTGRRFALLDIGTGARRNDFIAPDSSVWDWEPMPGGEWIWIRDGLAMQIHSAGRTRTIPKPDSYEFVTSLSSSPGGRVAFAGWNTGTADTMRVSELSLPGGTVIPWASEFVDDGSFRVLGDGSMFFHAWETASTAVLYHLTAPGLKRRLGMIPRPITDLSVSDDLRRAVVATEDYFGDAWISRVVRPPK